MSQPTSRREVLDLLNDYFHAVSQESTGELETVLTDDAMMKLKNQTSSTSALVVWIRRFARFDHADVSAASIYRASDLEMYTASELDHLSGTREFALKPQASEVLIKLRLRQRDPSGAQRFGAEMQAIIEWQSGRPRLAQIYEDLTVR